MIERILLIDNDLDEWDLFREALKGAKTVLKCSAAEDGNEAVDKLINKASGNIQLILLDINMPLIDGWETLDLLKKNEACQHIPVIMYSTSPLEVEETAKALKLGAAGFISKPVLFKQYINLVQAIASASKESIPIIWKEYKALNAKGVN